MTETFLLQHLLCITNIVFVFILEGLQTYSLVSALDSKNLKGQANVIALIVKVKEEEVEGDKAKATIWHYWTGTTEFIRHIDFSATGSHYIDEVVCELLDTYDPVTMCITHACVSH